MVFSAGPRDLALCSRSILPIKKQIAIAEAGLMPDFLARLHGPQSGPFLYATHNRSVVGGSRFATPDTTMWSVKVCTFVLLPIGAYTLPVLCLASCLPPSTTYVAEDSKITQWGCQQSIDMVATSAPQLSQSRFGASIPSGALQPSSRSRMLVNRAWTSSSTFMM